MDHNELLALDHEYTAQTYGRFDLAIARGKGSYCWDFDGKRYVDFTSGIGVNALGFSDDEWVSAVAAQAATLCHTSNLYYTEPYAELAEILSKRSGMKKVFFSNCGADANECAIKAARKYGFERHGATRMKILTLDNSFHGRTVATLEATGQSVMHRPCFGPYTGGFGYVMPNDIADLEEKADDSVCAIMIELVQGEGGVVPLDKAFVARIAKICAERDILLVIDEVQTGIGRTGSFYCFEQFGLKPDIVTSAKALGGGLPIGAALFGEKTENVLRAGDHATTFGANPITTAGGKVILERLTDAFLAEVKAKGGYIREKVAGFPKVVGTSGMGLMIGVAFEDGIKSVDVVKAAIKRGAMFLTAKSRLRMLPPLNIGYEEIDEGLAVLKKVLEEDV